MTREDAAILQAEIVEALDTIAKKHHWKYHREGIKCLGACAAPDPATGRQHNTLCESLDFDIHAFFQFREAFGTITKGIRDKEA